MNSIYSIPEQAIDVMIRKCAGEMNFLGTMVPSINAPLPMADMLRGKLLESGAPFVAIYWDEPDGRVFVLMSDENGQDVSEIARCYNGKGDKHTAMFKTPPQREMVGEFIPVELELPPDGEKVIALTEAEDGETNVREATHNENGDFDIPDVVAWAWMPELPGAGGV